MNKETTYCRWVESNENRPTKDGFYYAEDTAGQKATIHFYNDHWHSLTGHPVKYWLDESCKVELEGKDKDIQELVSWIEELEKSIYVGDDLQEPDVLAFYLGVVLVIQTEAKELIQKHKR